MRLLNTTTGRFKNVSDPQKIRYAILSHVWIHPEESKNPDGSFSNPSEMSYLDVRKISKDHISEPSILEYLSPKIRKFCEVARLAGYELGWVDTCCIDQTSSSELSESINSMFNWYRYSSVCYAYLHDYQPLNPRNINSIRSVWFNRVWTLQELLAPSAVLFFDSDWNPIGTKHTLARSIMDVSRVDYEVLTFKRALKDVCVARRLSWAATRKASRPEDAAYSLMGLFSVNMTTMYGEGGTRAFTRLQEEILKHIPDQTILFWGPSFDPRAYKDMIDVGSEDAYSPGIPQLSHNHCFLAPFSAEFYSTTTADLTKLLPTNFTSLLNLGRDPVYPRYTTTPYGINVRLPILESRHTTHGNRLEATHFALLACRRGNAESGEIAALLLCRVHNDCSTSEFTVGAIQKSPNSSQASNTHGHYYRTTYIPIVEIKNCAEKGWIKMGDLYLPTALSLGLEGDVPSHFDLGNIRNDKFDVRVAEWPKTLLQSQGYNVHTGPTSSITATKLERDHWTAGQPEIIIFKEGKRHDDIIVQVGRCYCQYDSRMDGYLAIRVASRTDADEASAEPAGTHKANHHTHIGRSNHWMLHSGVASREFRNIPGDFILRVTFTFDRDIATGTGYELAFEVRDNRELPSSPDTPLRFLPKTIRMPSPSVSI